jgi:hypothetical protein
MLEYLLVLSRHYPLLLPPLAFLLNHDDIDATQYEKHLNSILAESAVNRRSDGMSWALHLLRGAELGVGKDTAERVVASRDCTAIVLLDHLGAFGELVEKFVGSVDADDPYELDRYWLLMYQRFFHGKSPAPQHESHFDVLKEYEVDFLPEYGKYSASEDKLAVEKAGFEVVEESEIDQSSPTPIS